MTPRGASQRETIWTPGRSGWQGRQGSVATLVALAVIVGAAAIAYAVILLTEPSAPYRMQGVLALVIVALGGWMALAHVRVPRVRVVRVEAEPARLTFGRPRGIRAPVRLLGPAGVLLLAAWVWALPVSSSDRIPVLSLVLTPVIALFLIYGGVASLFRAGSRVILEPDRLRVVLPRTGLVAAWDDISEASFIADRVVIVLADGRRGGWAARDFASDPVVLAELISFYARTPEARREIGTAALTRLRSGEF